MTAPVAAPDFAIQGEFTIFTASATKPLLLEAIDQADAELEINLANVTEIDTAGLQLMILAKREAAARGKNLRFSHHSNAVVDLLDLCDLCGFFGDPVVIRPTH
jgi:anti-anti-sigma factor